MKERRGTGAGGGGGELGSGMSRRTPGKQTLVDQAYDAPSTGAAGVIQRKPLEGAAPQPAIQGDDHGHEQEPNPPGAGSSANLDVTRPVGSNIPDDVRTQLMTQVRTSARMQQVLTEIEAHGGAAFDIEWSTRGGFHSAGTIFIDRRQEMSSWIATMMHELNHLNDHRQGLNPSPATTASPPTRRRWSSTNCMAHHPSSTGVVYLVFPHGNGASSTNGAAASRIGSIELELHRARAPAPSRVTPSWATVSVRSWSRSSGQRSHWTSRQGVGQALIDRRDVLAGVLVPERLEEAAAGREDEEPIIAGPVAHRGHALAAVRTPRLVERIQGAFPRCAEHRVERRQPAADSLELGRRGELRVAGGFHG